MSAADIWGIVARSGLVRGAVTAEDAEMVHDAGLAIGLGPLQALVWQRMIRRDRYPVVTSSGDTLISRCTDSESGAK